MGKINVLSKEVANMISAGEVVERPASVVKELVENSIDAGAKSITVEIKNGGMTYIRVTDNGGGIEKDDVETAFLPHATSKIKEETDLSKIMTLGFRGEALASIAAVSNTEIFTKTENSGFGSFLSIKGGEASQTCETGCANGTTVIVRDLFFNTPARMKFLKKDSAETACVTDVINKFILGNPNIAIKYLCRSKNISSPGDGKLINSVFAVYGKDYINNVIEVDYKDENARVTGYIGNSQISRNTRAYQTFFINGRNFVSKIVSAALSEGYKNTVMIGKFPFAVLKIDVNPAFVDVNVHPTKMEVRFSDDKKIFEAVYWAVKNALERKKVIPEMKIGAQKQGKKKFDVPESIKKSNQIDINFLRDAFVAPKESYKTQNPQPLPQTEGLKNEIYAEKYDKGRITIDDLYKKEEKLKIADEGKYYADDEFVRVAKNIETFDSEREKEKAEALNSADTAKNEFAEDIGVKNPGGAENMPAGEKTSAVPLKAGVDFRIAGQIFSTYIIVERDSEMHIIDQHAAHERLYFEEFTKDYKEKNISSQLMLIPATVSLTPQLFETVAENKEFFAGLGFDVDEFGSNVVAVRKIPSVLEGCSVSALITEIAEILNKKKTADLTDLSLLSLHTMACKRAIKGNTPLSVKEMEDLVEKVYTLGNINTCPHGRPIEIKMSKKDLEKEFKRIV